MRVVDAVGCLALLETDRGIALGGLRSNNVSTQNFSSELAHRGSKTVERVPKNAKRPEYDSKMTFMASDHHPAYPPPSLGGERDAESRFLIARIGSSATDNTFDTLIRQTQPEATAKAKSTLKGRIVPLEIAKGCHKVLDLASWRGFTRFEVALNT